MGKAFDVIVVGARCAGSPTAMLLARKGYRVLVVDRASFPSDTVSTHILHPLGVDALAMGAARPPRGDRMPADPHLLLRLRPIHHRRRPGHGQGPERLLPTTDDPRQSARRCRSRIRCGDPSKFRRRGDHYRRRPCRRHQGSIKARRSRHGACRRHCRGRWPALDGERGGSTPSNTARSRPCWRVTTAIGAVCRWMAGLKAISATGAALP